MEPYVPLFVSVAPVEQAGAIASGTAHNRFGLESTSTVESTSTCCEPLVTGRGLAALIVPSELLCVDSGWLASLRLERSCHVPRVALFAACPVPSFSPRAARGWGSLHLDSLACPRPSVSIVIQTFAASSMFNTSLTVHCKLRLLIVHCLVKLINRHENCQSVQKMASARSARTEMPPPAPDPQQPQSKLGRLKSAGFRNPGFATAAR